MGILHYVLTDIIQLQYIFRILVAGICGMIIGFERKNRAKEAGIRTHFVVCCGSALIMVISKYGFPDMVGHDGARMAAQVVSGVGFLGAGIIFIQKRTVTGLTTAAGIWTTSGIGMAIGAGMYSVGIASTIIILGAQILLHKNSRFLKNRKFKVIKVVTDNKEGFQKYVTEMLLNEEIIVHDVAVIKAEADNNYVYEFEIDMAPEKQEEDVINLFSCECSIKPYR